MVKVKTPGNVAAGHCAQEADHGVRHQGLIVDIEIRDVAQMRDKIEVNGGATIRGPQELRPGFILTQFEDPEGNRFDLPT